MKKTLFLIPFIMGCASTMVTRTVYTANIFNKWIGKTSAELVQKNGVPSSSSSDENGGKILVYDNAVAVGSGASSPFYFYGKYAGSVSASSYQVFHHRIEYYVHSNGIIYKWLADGIPAAVDEKFKTLDIADGVVDTTLFIDPNAGQEALEKIAQDSFKRARRNYLDSIKNASN